MDKQPIEITQNAIVRIKQLIETRNNETSRESIGIKIGVDFKGCSGVAYKIEFAEKIDDNVEVITLHCNTKIIIEKSAMMFIIGSKMDYRESDLESGFIFANPNAKGECGCGESFFV